MKSEREYPVESVAKALAVIAAREKPRRREAQRAPGCPAPTEPHPRPREPRPEKPVQVSGKAPCWVCGAGEATTAAKKADRWRRFKALAAKGWWQGGQVSATTSQRALRWLCSFAESGRGCRRLWGARGAARGQWAGGLDGQV